MARKVDHQNRDMFAQLEHQACIINMPWRVVQELLDGTRSHEVRRRAIDPGTVKAYLYTGGAYTQVDGYVVFEGPKERSIESALKLFGDEQRESMTAFLKGSTAVQTMRVLERFAFTPRVRLTELIAQCPTFRPPEPYQVLALLSPNYESVRNFLAYRPGKASPPRGGCTA